MAKLTVRSSALLALLATAVAGSACAKNGQPTTTAERAEIAHGQMKAVGVAPSSTNRSVQKRKRKLSGINGITEFAG